jgi:pimeloyl-ACP methyl ester carboxylesterase
MSHFIIYKNIKVHYSDQGKGSAIVLLHGFLENSSMWNNLIPHLIKRNRVICIDLLGHGKTECLGYVHSMDLMAETVNAVLKKIRIRRIKLIGHSMGGYVALAFCNTFPGKVKALCLMNSTSRADSDEKKTNRDRAIEAVKNNYKTFVRISVSNLFKPSNRLILTKEIKEVTKEALKTPLQGIVAALEGMKNRPDRETLLSETSFKKMMIIGKEDPALDYNSLIEQTQNSDIKVVEFPDGHMSHIENIKEFTYNILHFIEK